MANKIQLRRDTSSNWTSSNPTLSQGELGHETNTGKLKVGDGSTAWTSLGYVDTTYTSSNFTHDDLTGFVANEHIDWTADQGSTNIHAGNYTDTTYTPPNHSGEVTSTGDGATVISDNVVDEANLKVSNSPTNGYVLTAQSGNTGGLTWAAAASGGGAALELYAENPSTPTAPSATGTNAVAIGYGSTASSTESVAIGDSTSSGINSIAIGENSTSSGNRSTAIGRNSFSGSADATAVGAYSIATTGSYANAFGHHAYSYGQDGTSIGRAYSSGTDSFAAAIANNSSSYGASGSNSIAMGKNAKATGANAISISGENATASGSKSFAAGGEYPTASGAFSVALGGSVNTASGEVSYAFGKRALASEVGKYAYGVQLISALGTTQGGMMVLISATTDATPKAMASNNSAAGSTNQIILPNNSAYSFSGTIIARESAAAGSDYASWEIKGALLRDANAASTVLGNGIVNKLYASAGASAWAVALSADTTNGGLKVEITGAAATNIRWVATVNTSEVTYA